MIDVENEIFTKIADAIHAVEGFENVYCTSMYEPVPESFPCVTCWEDANAVWRKGRDQSNMENFNDIGYLVEVYSNKEPGKKAEAKALANIVDSVMADLNMTRVLRYPTPNLADASVYRITIRYRGIVSSDGKIYYRR